MKVLRALLALIAAGTLVHTGSASASSTQAAALGGYSGSAAASGLHALYNPEGVLPLPPPVDIGAPDALASIASGPTTFARASVADPGDLLANPDALLALASSSYKAGTIPPYPYRVKASSSTGAPDDESAPAPGLNARVHADAAGSSAVATTPAGATPAVATVGSMSSAATTTIVGSVVTVHSRAEVSNLNVLGIVTIDSIVTDLTATSDAGAPPTLSGGTVITGAKVAGQPVTIDGEGIHQASDPTATTTPLDGLLGGVTKPALGSLNDALGRAGIHITLAGPVQQAGGTSAQLGSDGLRIALDLSVDAVPGLRALLAGLPPLPTPIPGAPSPEDLLVVAKAHHLGTLELARGVVTLAARPAAPAPTFATPSGPAAPAPAAKAAAGAPTAPGAVPARASSAPAANGSAGVVVPATEDASAAGPVGAGVGVLALLVLLAQPFIGDWLGRGSAALLSGDQLTSCPWEER